jgi:hypothetical protein
MGTASAQAPAVMAREAIAALRAEALCNRARGAFCLQHIPPDLQRQLQTLSRLLVCWPSRWARASRAA